MLKKLFHLAETETSGERSVLASFGRTAAGLGLRMLLAAGSIVGTGMTLSTLGCIGYVSSGPGYYSGGSYYSDWNLYGSYFNGPYVYYSYPPDYPLVYVNSGFVYYWGPIANRWGWYRRPVNEVTIYNNNTIEIDGRRVGITHDYRPHAPHGGAHAGPGHQQGPGVAPPRHPEKSQQQFIPGGGTGPQQQQHPQSRDRHGQSRTPQWIAPQAAPQSMPQGRGPGPSQNKHQRQKVPPRGRHPGP